MEFPYDCTRNIARFLSSYNRAKLCTVSKMWVRVMLSLVGTYKNSYDMVAAGDYHAMVISRDDATIDVMGAYQSGDDDVIKMVCDKYNDAEWPGAMIGAIRGGHLHLVRKGTLHNYKPYHKLFSCAYKYKRYDIVKYLLREYGTRNVGLCEKHYLDLLIKTDEKMCKVITNHLCVCDGVDCECIDYPVNLRAEALGSLNDWQGIEHMINDGFHEYGHFLNGAYWGGHVDLVHKLLDMGADESMVLVSNVVNNIVTLRYYCKRRVIDRMYALTDACKTGSLEIVKIVCEQLKDHVDFGMHNHELKFALQAACKLGNVDMVRYILEYTECNNVTFGPRLCPIQHVKCYGMYKLCHLIDNYTYSNRYVDNTGNYAIRKYIQSTNDLYL